MTSYENKQLFLFVFGEYKNLKLRNAGNVWRIFEVPWVSVHDLGSLYSQRKQLGYSKSD